MFQSVYDYPYLSSSANHIFDITAGYDEVSGLSGSTSVQNTKKLNIYNQYSQILLGYTGSSADGVRKFENDLTLDVPVRCLKLFSFSFSRLLTKDQIKKGSFSITIGTGSWSSPFGTAASNNLKVYADVSASATQETTNTIGGDDVGFFISVIKMVVC